MYIYIYTHTKLYIYIYIFFFSSIGTTARCALWPVEQYPSVFFLSVTNFLHLLILIT